MKSKSDDQVPCQKRLIGKNEKHETSSKGAPISREPELSEMIPWLELCDTRLKVDSVQTVGQKKTSLTNDQAGTIEATTNVCRTELLEDGREQVFGEPFAHEPRGHHSRKCPRSVSVDLVSP